MEYKNFTSLPPEQEATFIVYEQASNESAKKAKTMGIVVGSVIGVLGLVLFLSFDAPINAHAVEPESDLKEEPRKKRAAPPPTETAPAPEAAPGEAAPAEAAAIEAPEPPKGATKAPPTDLIK